MIQQYYIAPLTLEDFLAEKNKISFIVSWPRSDEKVLRLHHVVSSVCYGEKRRSEPRASREIASPLLPRIQERLDEVQLRTQILALKSAFIALIFLPRGF